jgi:hypothetical protein
MENKPEVNPAVWVIYIIIATLIVFLFAVNDDKYTPVIQTFVLTLTLFALVWYTFETRRMQQAVRIQAETAIRQTNLSTQPIFTVHIGEVQTESNNHLIDRVELENIGNGVALNVQIDTLNLDLGTKMVGALPEPHIVFERMISIGKGKRAMVEHTVWANAARSEDYNVTQVLDLIRHLSPPMAEKDYEMKIRFSDIMGNRYVQTIHVGQIGSWPDAVEIDTGPHPEKTPAYSFEPSLFTSSPMKYLKRKRPTPQSRS